MEFITTTCMKNTSIYAGHHKKVIQDIICIDVTAHEQAWKVMVSVMGVS